MIRACACRLFFLLAALAPVAPPALAAGPIDPFVGHWVGVGITENQGPSSAIAFADRDLAMTIESTDRGFSITWMALFQSIGKKTVEPKSWKTSVTFVPAGRDGLYRMEVPGDPAAGEPYRWAYLAGATLTVHSIAVFDNGTLEHQTYVRTLVSENEMRIDYSNARDNKIVRSVMAVAKRDKGEQNQQ